MKTLGVAMIVKDEEEMLEGCLKSIQGADEIVILDTGSTDRTGEIARKYTDKYYAGEYVWNNNFAEARNVSMGKCTTDWILMIDANGRLDPGGIETLKGLINKLDPDIDAISIAFYNDHEEFFNTAVFKNDPDVRYVGEIHECVYFRKMIQDERVRIRFNISPTHAKNPQRNLEIIESVLRREPDNTRMQYCAGREYFIYGYYPNSIYWLERYKRTMKLISPEYADAMLMLGLGYFKMLEYEMAKDSCLIAIKINADFRDPFALLAEIAKREGDIINEKKWQAFSDTSRNIGLNWKKKCNYLL